MTSPASLPALKLGPLAVDPAVVLAPMAGITNPAFRTLCREFGAGLYVCEMITTRALVERNEKTLQMVRATPDEKNAFSVQLYGVDPATVGRAVEMLVDEVDIPVLGNGDIWEADDALRMIAETGCAGVVIGRGCLGRPWLFGDLAAAFAGQPRRALPTLREVAAVMHRHARLLGAEQGERHGCTDFRKHVAWYLKGFSVGSDVRRALAMVSALDELAELLAGIPDQHYPTAVLGGPRGRTRPPRPVALPDGWLDDRDDPRPPAGAELLVSGGWGALAPRGRRAGGDRSGRP